MQSAANLASLSRPQREDLNNEWKQKKTSYNITSSSWLCEEVSMVVL